MNISFLWWNTSLSPVGKDRASKEQKIKAHEMVDIFINDFNLDLIALGEVKESDILDIKKNCNIGEYGIYNGYEKAGRGYFDTCVLYKKNKLNLLDSMRITASKGKRTFKIAQRLDFSSSEHDVPFHIFISHWPSRLHMKQNDPERAFLGIKLRDSIAPLIDLYKGDASLILLGDYNDEPFDASLSEHLMATRDRGLAHRKEHLLYNPFWRKIGHPAPYTHDGENTKDDGGTYFHKSGTDSRWRTFDQIIFSSNFLGRSKWHINESLTTILEFPSYKKLVLNPKEIFDHFPVIGVIEKVT